MTEKTGWIISGKNKKILAVMGLLLVTVIWGSSFVVMKTAMDAITPAYLLAFRFTIAAVGLTIVFWKLVKTITLSEIRYGSILGLFLFVSYYLQTYGLKYTTASKNAFITTLYVIIVPFLHWLFNKVRPGRNNVIAAVIAVIGLALLSLKGDLTVNLGDVLTFLCGITFAVHMVFVDRYTAVFHPVKLTVIQMVSCGILGWLVAGFTEGPCDFSVFAGSEVILSVLYLGIVASMICFLLQMVGQTYLSPNTASILLSFEAVTGLVFSVIFLREVVTVRMLIGCGLMFAAAILSEYRPSEKRDRGIRDLTAVQEERNEDGEIIIHS